VFKQHFYIYICDIRRCIESVLFGFIDLSVLVKKVRFRDPQPDSVPIIPCDGIPFVVVGRKLLECHQGIDRDGHRKEKRRNEKQKNVKLKIRNKEFIYNSMYYPMLCCFVIRYLDLYLECLHKGQICEACPP
jgi:hypothetical protein